MCAARSEDIEESQKMVDAWRKYLGHQNYTAENGYCAGCRNEGPHADKECKARPCAMGKDLENCALCDEFPCDKMRPLMSQIQGMFTFGYKNFSQITEADYNLCMRQWNSVPNLFQTLIDAGKLPEWLKNQRVKGDVLKEVNKALMRGG